MNAPEPFTLGLMPNLPAERYHAIQAMSAGGLKRMRQSPAHFYGLQLDPNRPPPGEPTPNMKAGTLFHCALFESTALAERYVVIPADAPRRPTEIQRRAAKPSPETVASIRWWDDFEARARGAEIIEPVSLAKAKAQAARVRADRELGALLDEGFGEVSAFWIDPLTGELCKCRPDWTSPTSEGVILVDGKTCPDASPEGFARTAWNMGYVHTAAWYIDGYEAATGVPVHGYVFAAVEHDWPHVAKGWMVPDDVLDKARAENRRLLNLYAECRRTGSWPGYGEGIDLITLPRWALKEIA